MAGNHGKNHAADATGKVSPAGVLPRSNTPRLSRRAYCNVDLRGRRRSGGEGRLMRRSRRRAEARSWWLTRTNDLQLPPTLGAVKQFVERRRYTCMFQRGCRHGADDRANVCPRAMAVAAPALRPFDLDHGIRRKRSLFHASQSSCAGLWDVAVRAQRSSAGIFHGSNAS